MRKVRSTSFLLACAAIVSAVAATAEAGPLTVVNVNSPAYQFVFSPTGTVVVNDTVDTFAVAGAAGLARLQSRTTIGQPGAPAAGLYRYSYRLNLTDVYGITFIPCIKAMTIKFGAVVSTLDYNGDSVSGDHVFVVTSGGLGSVGIASAVQSGSNITFTFAGGGVCAGSSPGNGDSSYFFGLVSTRAPKFVTATVTDGLSNTYTPQARAPKSLLVVSSDVLHGLLTLSSISSEAMALTLNIDAVSNNRFAGTLRLQKGAGRDETTIAVDGTLSPGGHLQFSARGRGAQVMVSANEDDDGVFVGRYRVALADGTTSDGVATLAFDPRLIPVPSLERVEGDVIAGSR